MEQLDIAVIGGGMVGLTLACALGSQGLSVAVVDPAPAEGGPDADSADYDCRVSALTPASEQILRNLGAWETMAARRVAPYREMEVWDGEGTGRIHFRAADMHVARLGHIVENRVTLAGLSQALSRHGNVTRVAGAVSALSAPAQGRRTLTLGSGESLSARLVVAADGARSATRRLAGLGVESRDYEHHALITTVETEQPLQATAWQRFTEDGPLAFLPLAGDGHQASIVWSTSPDHARDLMKLEDADFAHELEAAFESRLGRVRMLDQRRCLPLVQRHAPRYVIENLALVGDAAHSIHPLAGQGVNLGLLDAAILAEEILLAEAAQADFAGLERLRRYQRRRQGDNLQMIALMGALHRLYGPVPPPLRWLRNRGMSLVDQLRPIKRMLVAQAMGQRADLPQLARDKPLGGPFGEPFGESRSEAPPGAVAKAGS